MWLFILPFIFWLIIIQKCDAFCPIKCHCDNSLLLADCTNGSLDLVPITLNPQLKELHLAFNQIKSIKETLSFYNNLLFLDLTANQLNTLGEKNFNQLKHLKVLKVGNNKISKLNNLTFSGLNNLEQLYLSRNEFRTLQSNVFNSLTRLQFLDLSQNAIVNINNDVFSNFLNLKTLDLSQNRFDHKLSNIVFDRLTSLEYLYLDYNSFQHLSDFLFRSLTNLKILTLNNCNLRSLNRNLFYNLKNLKHLQLNHNQFDRLSTDVFIHLEQLESLELQGTSFSYYPSIFSNLKALKHLSLGYDRFLKKLPNDLFVQNEKILSLEIENCPYLEQLPNGIFNSQRKLIFLNLGQNALTSIQPSIFLNYSFVQRLVLTGNPLHCNCNLAWIYSSPSLKINKLSLPYFTNDLKLKSEDIADLNKIIEKWLSKQETNPKIKNIIVSSSSNFKSYTDKNLTFYKKTFDLSSNTKKSNDDLYKRNYLNVPIGSVHPNSIGFNSKEQNENYHSQITNNQMATCFEPLALVGRPLIDLTAAELNCDSNDHQSIIIDGEKINFENRNPAMVISYDENQNQVKDKSFYNSEEILNKANSSGLSFLTFCFLSILVFSLVLLIVLLSFIYIRRHKKKDQPISISSWILKPGVSSTTAHVLGFQPFNSFDLNQEHLINNNSPKCNTLINPLAKLGPLPKKPIANNLNQSNMDNFITHSTIKPNPKVTKISLMNNSSLDSNNKIYEQIDYGMNYREQIYEDLTTDNCNENSQNNYTYNQLNSTTSTTSSYLSGNGLNVPSTYEDFLATSMMRNNINTYGTLNSNNNHRILNTNFKLNNNYNRTNTNRRTINTIAHL